MLGAVIGDIIGSQFESSPIKSTEFELFNSYCHFTDDTVCTVAITDWLFNSTLSLTSIMQGWCRRYIHQPDVIFGSAFKQWIMSSHPQPYNSFGNGSAMRVSAVSWYHHDLKSVLCAAQQSAQITHNHPEGIKGAQAIAAAIFLARTHMDKENIKNYIIHNFGYNLQLTCNDIRPYYQFDTSCQGSVPQAIIAFLESNNFEHAIRLAISLGGDSDTLAAMTGSIAEAFYGEIPANIIEQTKQRLPQDFLEILQQIEAKRG